MTDIRLSLMMNVVLKEALKLNEFKSFICYNRSKIKKWYNCLRKTKISVL